MKVLLLSLAILAPALPVQAEVSFIRYVQESACHGEAESQFILGLAYGDGWEGTIKSGSIADQWRSLAAELDDQRPAFVLALLQKEKDRVRKDEAKAVQCLTQAAGLGDDYARVILGEMFLEGNGVTADWRRGTEWIKKAAQAGFAPAQFRLGVIYLVGDASTPRDDIEALAWFIVAADAGSKSALQFRDDQTKLLGREAARLAIQRTRAILHKGQ